jgi:hypothetical protein
MGNQMLAQIIAKVDQYFVYLYVPYQGLQLIGYRLVGKQCAYIWGRSRVKPIGPATLKQHLAGLLLPVAVFGLILVLELALATYILLLYYTAIPWIIIPLVIGAAIPLSPYFYQVVFDIWRAYRLLRT